MKSSGLVIETSVMEAKPMIQSVNDLANEYLNGYLMIVKPVMQLIVAGAESVSKAMVTPIRLSYDF